MTSVAAIVPTRDRAAMTLRAVASVLAQTRPADEVIVVDDGSTDGTSERLREAFPDVRVLRSGGRGVSAARNHGIRAARSEWLAFLDSDDEWLEEKLEAQLEALAAEHAPPEAGRRNAPPEAGQVEKYLLCHTDEIWIRRGRRVNPRRRHEKRGGFIFRHCLPLCAISPSSALLHRALFDRVGPFDESLPACEDYDLWLRICARYPVLYVDRPLVKKYGGHADQLSRAPGLDRYRIRALEKILVNGDLSAADRRAAVATLEDKIRVYAGGAARRGRLAEVRELERLRARFAGSAAEAPAAEGPVTQEPG